MKFRQLTKKLSLTFVFTACFGGAAAAEIEGSCLNYYERDTSALGEFNRQTGEIKRNGVIPVMVERTDLFEEPNSRSRRVGSLEFNQRLNPIAQSEDGQFIRVRADTRNISGPLGWVAADDVLCRHRALTTDEGIARKFYIRTAANADPDEEIAVVPTSSPNGDTCARLNDLCQELTRFDRFYVVAEDHQNSKILLTAAQLVEALTPLNGWVSVDDGYRWNTRLGFRPADRLVVNEATGSLVMEEEITSCVYETKEEAANSTPSDTCDIPVLGGPRWYNSRIRLPVLAHETIGGQDYYEVAVPVAGVGAQSRGALLEQVAGLDNAIRELQGLKNLDIFFLIDGTQSMEPHIDALVGRRGRPGIIQKILDSIKGDVRFSDVRARFGYRVYRDTYAGNFGINEGLELSANCNPTSQELRENRDRFNDGIQRIDTSRGAGKGGDPDDEEALFPALVQTVIDMTACESNAKLLFVIGDTGTDSQALIGRGVPDSLATIEPVVGHLVNGVTARSIDPIIPFFIHVPEASRALRRTGEDLEGYFEAYKLFERQAKTIIATIGKVYQDSQKVPVQLSISENYFEFDERDEAGQDRLTRVITDQVALFGDQRPVNEIIAGLQTGEALVEIIEALQSRASDVPALRLAQIERRICNTLGEACTQQIFSETTSGYVRVDDKAQLDVLVTADEFDRWRDTLEPLENCTDCSIHQQARLILDNLTKGVERSLGEMAPYELDLPISEFLAMTKALPSSSKTPLMNYTVRDLMNAEELSNNDPRLEPCEIYNLRRWLAVRLPIFRDVNTGNVPIISPTPIDSGCPMRNASIKELTYKDFKDFPEKSMNYSFAEFNSRWFWIPNEFLP